MTAIHTFALPDTVLLLDFAAGNDEVDYSQYRQNLTNNTTYLSEANSARTALSGRREIYISLNVRSGETGVLLELGNNSTYSYQVAITAGNVIECRENGSLRVSVANTSLVVGSDREVRILWSIHPDGTDTRHELSVNTPATSNILVAQATTATGTVDPTDTLTIGAAFGGASAFSGGLDFRYVRIGRRFHSGAEWREQFIAQTTPPSMTQTRRGTPLVPDRATLDIADDGSFAGPAHLWSGHVYEQADRRLVGALLNERVLDPLQIKSSYDMPTSAWWRTAPDDEAFMMPFNYLFYRPVPGKVSRAHVRLRIRHNQPSDTSTCDVKYRVYSMAGLPVKGEGGSPLKFYRTQDVTNSTDHGTALTAGTWLNLGELPLAVDEHGFTWLAVGVWMDLDDPLAADHESYIHGFTVDPYFEPAGDGSYGFEDP